MDDHRSHTAPGCFGARRRVRAARRRLRRVRHHRRPGEGDDAALALPPRGARAPDLPDRRRRRRRLDRRRPQAARPRGDRRPPARRSTRRSSTASPPGSPTSPATSPTPATFERLAGALKDARSPVFYLEIPPFLFGTVVKGLAGAGLTENARVVVEKPFGHDLESARALAAEMHEYLDESPALPDRPLPREARARGDPLPALRERDARAGLAPQPRRERPDHDGRELRRRGPRPLLRPGRRAARRRRQPPHAGRRGGGDGGAGRARSGHAQERHRRRLPRDAAGRPGALRPRPVRRLPRDRRRRRRTRRPRPTRRCGWRSTTGAGPACRSSSAPASACRSPRPSCGWCSSGRRASASTSDRAAGADQLVVKLDPDDRRPADCSRRSAAERAEPEQINLDMEFADGGRRGPGALRGAAARRDGRATARASRARTASRRPGACMQPLVDVAAAGPPVRQGHVGPGRRRTASSPATAAGTSPGSSS